VLSVENVPPPRSSVIPTGWLNPESAFTTWMTASGVVVALA
jgi:hypothetical protein